MTLLVGTRASPLARIQAEAVIDRLKAGGMDARAVPLQTRGDQSLGGDLSTHVGQFVTGLDARLLNGEVDLKSEKEGALFVTSVCIQQESAPVLIVVPHKSDVVLWTEELLSVCPEIVVVQYIGGDREQELIRGSSNAHEGMRRCL